MNKQQQHRNTEYFGLGGTSRGYLVHVSKEYLSRCCGLSRFFQETVSPGCNFPTGEPFLVVPSEGYRLQHNDTDSHQRTIWPVTPLARALMCLTQCSSAAHSRQSGFFYYFFNPEEKQRPRQSESCLPSPSGDPQLCGGRWPALPRGSWAPAATATPKAAAPGLTCSQQQLTRTL